MGPLPGLLKSTVVSFIMVAIAIVLKNVVKTESSGICVGYPGGICFNTAKSPRFPIRLLS